MVAASFAVGVALASFFALPLAFQGVVPAPSMPGQSIESISEAEARRRTAWPHWKDTPTDEPAVAEELASDVALASDAVLESSLRCVEAAVDAFVAASAGSPPAPHVAERLRRATARLKYLETRLDTRKDAFF
mmetsp:Transcript_35344/g.112991  ORF Transcript_35344/g.112991 Transcript_35344/m.112991 type:complete len:133 (+) Transcript_35344:23-421(+)